MDYLMLLAVVLSNISGERLDIKGFIMCAAVFVINGFTSVVSKLHQIDVSHGAVSTLEFVILVSLMKFVISGIGYIVARAFERSRNFDDDRKKAR